MIVGIHHAQVGIPRDGLAATRAFYCDLLGLKEIDRPFGPDGVWVQAGDRAVHFGLDEVTDRSASRQHIAYEVDDLNEMRSRLRQAGIAIEECPKMPLHERIQIRDPFGNQVEFIMRER
jgi:catechol 2,3-dioxygenase-like lactoylglutathione lyase family enzyme